MLLVLVSDLTKILNIVFWLCMLLTYSWKYSNITKYIFLYGKYAKLIFCVKGISIHFRFVKTLNKYLTIMCIFSSKDILFFTYIYILCVFFIYFLHPLNEITSHIILYYKSARKKKILVLVCCQEWDAMLSTNYFHQ